ncbi:MAG: FHA domain-containing protein [Planctomycetota bacterium]
MGEVTPPEELPHEPPSGPRYALRVVKGDDKGREIPLSRQRTTIGRRLSNDVVLKEIQVSGVHAEIVFEGGRAVLRDLGSTNGTYLDSGRIDEVVLDSGETIRVGATELLFVDRQAEEQVSRALDGGQAKAPERHRVPRKRIGGVVLLGILVAAVGAAAYLYFGASAKSSGERVVARSDNVAGAVWSFEDPAEVAERVDLELEGVQAFRLSSGEAHSGERALRAELGPSESAVALVRQVTVRAARLYRIRVHVRGVGGARAFLGVRGMGALLPGDELERSLASVEPGPEYRMLEGVTGVPRDAAALDVVLAARGPGTVDFDDLEVLDEGGVEAVASQRLGDGLELLRQGPVFALVQGGQPVLRGGHVVLRRGDAGPRLPSVIVDAVTEQTLEPGSVTVTSRVTGVTPGDRVAVGLQWIPRDGELLVRTLSPRGVEEYTGSFSAGALEALLLGSGKTLLEVRFRETGAVRAQWEEKSARVELEFPQAEDGPRELAYVVNTDFRGRVMEASALLYDADQLLGQRRDGEAYAKAEAVLNRLPYDEDAVARARSIAQRVLTDGREQQRHLEGLLEVAAFLESPSKLEEAERKASEALQRFAQTPLAGALESLLSQARERRGSYERALQEEHAARLFHVARGLLAATRREGTARLILSYLTERYPETDGARQAAEVLAASSRSADSAAERSEH